MKKLFTLVLAIAMIMTLAVPAMAADTTYPVTITNADQKSDHTYEAYQIFTGNLTTKTLNDKEVEVLDSVEWGKGVDGTSLVAALNEISAFAAAKNAQDVADILSKDNLNETLVNSFRDAVAKCLTTDDTNIYTATQIETSYSFGNLAAGYYLIKDKDDSLDEEGDDTYTNFILQVVGETDVAAKAGCVTVDKVIKDGGTEKTIADYSIGDIVYFEIDGTIPDNYDRFSEFNYKFVDTMDNAFTYNKDVKVYIENAGKVNELESKWYKVEVTNNADGSTGIVVDLGNLKSIPGHTIDKHSTIRVAYTAILDADAVPGTPEPNTVHIEYSNDPHSDSWGKTIEDKVYAFTWELDVTKIDGSKENRTTLTGAEFVLYRELLGTANYVQVAADGTVTGWTTEKTQASTLTSDENGKFIVKGLEADLYHLQETKAPDGYNLREDPISVDITYASELDATGVPVVKDLKIKVGLDEPYDGNKDTGIVAMDYINKPGATLPETGGVGTTLFYVFGSIMVLAAVVLLVTKKRMGAQN